MSATGSSGAERIARTLAERIHAIITATAPELSPKTWQGMPGYAKKGKVLCFFQAAQKFDSRSANFRRAARSIRGSFPRFEGQRLAAGSRDGDLGGRGALGSGISPCSVVVQRNVVITSPFPRSARPTSQVPGEPDVAPTPDVGRVSRRSAVHARAGVAP